MIFLELNHHFIFISFVFFEFESSFPYPLKTQEISVLLFAHLMNSGIHSPTPWSHLYGISLGLLPHYLLGILDASLCPDPRFSGICEGLSYVLLPYFIRVHLPVAIGGL